MEIVFNCYEISCDKGELFDKVRKVLDFAGLQGSLQDCSQVNITVKMLSERVCILLGASIASCKAIVPSYE
jgi:hypothetical protein